MLDIHLIYSALDELLSNYDGWCDVEGAAEYFEYFESNFEISGSDLISVYSEVSSLEIFDYLVETLCNKRNILSLTDLSLTDLDNIKINERKVTYNIWESFNYSSISLSYF